MSDSGDQLMRAFAVLAGLRANVGDHLITEQFARDYETKLREVAAATGQSMDDFMVPEDWYYHHSYGRDRSGSRQSAERYVKRELFLSRFDGAMNYLRMLMPVDAPRKIGF